MSRYEALAAIVEPVVSAAGFEFWGLEFVSRKSGTLLRVFIDGVDGVTVDDCAAVSRELSVILDVEDPINTEYLLEVSSPGMARRFFRLDQYSAYVGWKLQLKLNTLFEGRRQFTGILKTVDLERREIGVVVDDEEIILPYEQIDKGKLVPVFD